MPKKRNENHPPLFTLGCTELTHIFRHLSAPLDKFHFSAVIQQSPKGRKLLQDDKPRQLFKKIRGRVRGKAYKRPPSLPRAMKMTSKWVKQKGRCMDCLRHPCAVHIDLLREDEHSRCFYCIRRFYKKSEDSLKCPCGLNLSLVRCTSAKGTKARPYFLILYCTKRQLKRQCRHPNLWKKPTPNEWKRKFQEEYGCTYLQFDSDRCYPNTQISDAHDYWSPGVDRRRQMVSLRYDSRGKGWETPPWL